MTSKEYNLIFVHGFAASPQTNWFPFISKQLKSLKIAHQIPSLPDSHHPTAEDWINKIHQYVSSSRLPIVLIGHSLGCRAILLYLEKYKTPIEAAFLIARYLSI